MHNFSYLPRRRSPLAAAFRNAFSAIEASRRMRTAFLLCAVTALVCSLATSWENIELRGAALSYERSRNELDTADVKLSGLRDTVQTLGRLGAAARQVADIRADATAKLQRVESAGDKWSGASWLVALHEDAGELRLRGHALSAADAGTTLERLRGVWGGGSVHLERLHTLGNATGGIVEFDVTVAGTKS